MAESIQAPYSSRGHIQGDVAIAPGVALADGALLGAAPGYRLVISAGVCLGADVVIQASHGDIVIEPGASLGSGVVVVGQGRIGQQACIGANSTVINPAIAATQVVPPQSLLGDPSQPRSVAEAAQNDMTASLESLPSTAPDRAGSQPTRSIGDGSKSESPPSPTSDSADPTSPGPGTDQKLGSYVYGQTQVNRLLDTLFPHRQPLDGASRNGASRNGASSEDKP